MFGTHNSPIICAGRCALRLHGQVRCYFCNLDFVENFQFFSSNFHLFFYEMLFLHHRALVFPRLLFALCQHLKPTVFRMEVFNLSMCKRVKKVINMNKYTQNRTDVMCNMKVKIAIDVPSVIEHAVSSNSLFSVFNSIFYEGPEGRDTQEKARILYSVTGTCQYVRWKIYMSHGFLALAYRVVKSPVTCCVVAVWISVVAVFINDVAVFIIFFAVWIGVSAEGYMYRAASVSSIYKSIGLFCKRAL